MRQDIGGPCGQAMGGPTGMKVDETARGGGGGKLGGRADSTATTTRRLASSPPMVSGSYQGGWFLPLAFVTESTLIRCQAMRRETLSVSFKSMLYAADDDALCTGKHISGE